MSTCSVAFWVKLISHRIDFGSDERRHRCCRMHHTTTRRVQFENGNGRAKRPLIRQRGSRGRQRMSRKPSNFQPARRAKKLAGLLSRGQGAQGGIRGMSGYETPDHEYRTSCGSRMPKSLILPGDPDVRGSRGRAMRSRRSLRRARNVLLPKDELPLPEHRRHKQSRPATVKEGSYFPQTTNIGGCTSRSHFCQRG